MKSLAIFVFVFSQFLSFGQDITGAWEFIENKDSSAPKSTIMLFVDGYYVRTQFESPSGRFIGTQGGAYILKDNKLHLIIEFDSEIPEKVGNQEITPITLDANGLSIGLDIQMFSRLNATDTTELQGAWLMAGRVRNGETSMRDTSGSRKTMKILVGSRFQWIAYDIDTKDFKGSGGGTYTAKDGVYEESLGFFSRDVTRVGLKLIFEYNVIENNWHHKGLSSGGAAIHEIWSRRIN